MSADYDLRDNQLKRACDIPDGPAWIIIVFDKSSVRIPGDERSRTNPGHGYPAHTNVYDTNKIFYFSTPKEWREALDLFYKEDMHRSDILAFESVGVAKVKTGISVEVSKD
tara:strand:- start:222 stop:554 length:333 start_codon:yes stop_codon:yes gene_type:complete